MYSCILNLGGITAPYLKISIESHMVSVHVCHVWPVRTRSTNVPNENLIAHDVHEYLMMKLCMYKKIGARILPAFYECTNKDKYHSRHFSTCLVNHPNEFWSKNNFYSRRQKFPNFFLVRRWCFQSGSRRPQFYWQLPPIFSTGTLRY